MTSVAVSAILFIVSFVVLMVLVMKGVNLIPAAIIGSIILSFAVEGGPINALLTLFSGARADFVPICSSHSCSVVCSAPA